MSGICINVYYQIGETEKGIAPVSLFDELPDSYCCALCNGDKESFVLVDKSVLGLPAV